MGNGDVLPSASGKVGSEQGKDTLDPFPGPQLSPGKQRKGSEALTGPSPPCRYIGALGARVICDNIPGLVSRQRQLCQRYPDIMRSVGEGAREWIRECQHQFRHHRWNCTTLERDHTVFGRVMLRSRDLCSPAPMFGVVVRGWVAWSPLLSYLILCIQREFVGIQPEYTPRISKIS